jgi:two-component system cell cycle sensor histidine kinase/response regulator CckA
MCSDHDDDSPPPEGEPSSPSPQTLALLAQLARPVAHELNNILTSISMNVSLALMDLSPQDPLHESLEEINTATGRATETIAKLRSFSRAQRICRPVEIVLDEMLEDLRSRMDEVVGEGLDLTLKLAAGEAGLVRADPWHLEQIVVNLLRNARDAMPDERGGALVVETARLDLDPPSSEGLQGLAPGPHVTLAVRDTGEGIEPAVHARLFDPFFTTRVRGKGLGLGLLTVYAAVSQHEGAIRIDSNPGEGTTVMIYLPRIVR